MIIAIDFDGTLCKNCYPEIGEAIEYMINYVKVRKRKGDKIILWTCRKEEELQAAVNWCREQGLEFDAVNENLQECIENYGGDTRKIYANFYIDDKSMAIHDVMEIESKMVKKHYSKADCERKRYVANVADGDCRLCCDMNCPWGEKIPCENCGLIDCKCCEEKDLFIERTR